MTTPTYLRILAEYRWLLIAGALVSVIVGLLAGLTVRDGEIVPRAEQSFPASTTILLSNPSTPIYQTVIPGEQIPLPPGGIITDTITIDLSDTAVIYAYLVSSEEILGLVEDEVGALEPEETITGVSRTTQPAGDENFPGRLALPILDVVAYSPDPERAETLSAAAADVFVDYIAAQQDREEIDPRYRVALTPLVANPVGDPEGGNPAIPIVVAALASFAAFVALAFIAHAIRTRRTQRAAPAARDDDAGDAESQIEDAELEQLTEPAESEPALANRA